MGRDSSVSIATRYRLEGPRIDSQWRARFSAPVQTGPGPTQPPVQWVPRLFPEGVKRPGCGVDNSTHLAPWLKKEYSYTSNIPLSLHGLLEGELSRYLYLRLKFKFLPHRKHSLQHAIARFIAMSVYSDHTKTTNTLFPKCRRWCMQPGLSSLPLQRSGVPRNFVRGGSTLFEGRGSTNSVEDRGQRERESGSGSPLVRGSAQFASE
jgi:hypothetical protein